MPPPFEHDTLAVSSRRGSSTRRPVEAAIGPAICASRRQLSYFAQALNAHESENDVARRRRARRSAPNREARRDRSGRRADARGRSERRARRARRGHPRERPRSGRGFRPARGRRGRARSPRRPRESARACPASRARDAASRSRSRGAAPIRRACAAATRAGVTSRDTAEDRRVRVDCADRGGTASCGARLR